jgi:hypothetical protein
VDVRNSSKNGGEVAKGNAKGKTAPKGKKEALNLGVVPRNSQVQLRNNNVGMFSGPRPSYGRYSTSFAARDAVLGTGE